MEMKDGAKTLFQADWHGAEPSFNPGAYVDIDDDRARDVFNFQRQSFRSGI